MFSCFYYYSKNENVLSPISMRTWQHLSRDWRIFSKIPVVLSMRHQLILMRIFCKNFNCCCKCSCFLCVCGLPSISLHYVLDCLLTTYYHFKKYRNMAIPDWINYVSECPVIMNRISALMKVIEKNGVIFRNNIIYTSQDTPSNADLWFFFFLSPNLFLQVVFIYIL